MAGDELEFVEWLRTELPGPAQYPEMTLGIGDDMATLATSSGSVCLSCDMLLDGVHFDTTKHELPQIGRKAIACSLSDCAAMAVRPVAVLVSVALPSEFTLVEAKALFGGMRRIAAAYDTVIVGGDTTRWAHRLAIDVAITAVPFSGIAPVSRSGARPGDALHVTGPLGGSLLGHHLSFTPRVHEARKIAETLGADLHAMMDLSDGLSLDLWRMCRASHTGAILNESQIDAVVSDDARRCADDNRNALSHALEDGEDFELLLATAGEAEVPGVELYRVGVVTQEGLRLRHADGRTETITPTGYIH